ncbi:MAG: hypothetical protein ACI83P_000231 [Janthinobacterium sp.]|jgi:hypothetical protein
MANSPGSAKHHWQARSGALARSELNFPTYGYGKKIKRVRLKDGLNLAAKIRQSSATEPLIVQRHIVCFGLQVGQPVVAATEPAAAALRHNLHLARGYFALKSRRSMLWAMAA